LPCLSVLDEILKPSNHIYTSSGAEPSFNYEYSVSSVLVRNGLFEYDSKDIDKKGNISKTITLQKILDIRTIIDSTDFTFPGSITNSNYPDNTIPYRNLFTLDKENTNLNISVMLKNLKSKVKVQSYKIDKNNAACAIFRRKDDPISKSHFVFGKLYTGLSSQEIVSPTIWQIDIEWHELLMLQPGEYIVKPFLNVLQDSLPRELLNSIGEDVTRASIDYLNVPFKMETDTINILHRN